MYKTTYLLNKYKSLIFFIVLELITLGSGHFDIWW